MLEVYTRCDKCNKEINYGEPYVAIQRNVEHAEYDKTNNAVDAYILDSELLIILCSSCSNIFQTDALAKLIKAIPMNDAATELS